MDLTISLSIGILVYLAFVFDMLGFMARDELWLRLLMLTASAFYLVYYFFVTDVPLWDALITNGILAGINLFMIGIVILERTTIAMSEEHTNLYRSFSMLTPGQFRRLVKLGQSVDVHKKETLTVAGQVPDRLFFISQGPVEVDKFGERIELNGDMFIGELAYLSGDAASANVSALPGARHLSWRVEDLHKICRKHPALNVAMAAQFNFDLAQKVAASKPLGYPATT